MAKPLRLSREITEKLVDQLVEALILAPPEDPCRKFLEARGLYDEKWIAELEVGCHGTMLVFPQRDEDGRLLSRYRTYDTVGKKESRWKWSLGDGPTLSLWPWRPAPAGCSVWIVEGEWDAWTMLKRLGLRDAGGHACTWTGGASVAVTSSQVPTWMRSRRIDVCYDNDVYQGPTWATHRAPSEKALAAMRSRRTALLRTCTSLERHGCDVWLRAVPVDPMEKWGGDLRDWVEAGGRALDSIPEAPLADVRQGELDVVKRGKVDDVVLDAGLVVNFRCSVQTVEEDGVVLPIQSELDCEMGTKRVCGDCRAPTVCPDKVLDWSEHLAILIEAMVSRGGFERKVLQGLLGKPARCAYARVKTLTYKAVCRWTAATAIDGAREVTIFSEQLPNMSGDTEVEGTVYHGGDGSIVVLAHRVAHLDFPKPDVRANMFALHEIALDPRPKAEDVAALLARRAAALSRTTRIYGRPMLHQVFDLLFHSVMWLKIDSQVQRAWLDVAVVGDTGSGKSSVAQRMIQWLGLGAIHTCMENVSRAGLTMGAVKDSRGNYRTRPGLLPRNNGKLLVLDEFHVMVEEGWDRGDVSPMTHLQSARDVGYVEGVKVYGARRLSAAVRLATISNWCGGRVSTWKFPAEHFGQLYGRPEVLRRLDVGISVAGQANLEPPTCAEMPQEIARVLVLRAWAMKVDDIVLEPAAIERARSISDVWADRYSEELALFTAADKANSLLRLAAAASCICFSHPAGEPEKCLVTAEHVEWAKGWLEQVWLETGYEEFSAAAKQRATIAKPFHVERLLTADLGLFDATDALQALDRLFVPVTKAEMMTYLRKSPGEVESWCATMVRLGALETVQSRNAYHREWRLTRGAHRVLRNLVAMATEAPELFSARVARLDEWFTTKRPGEPSMVSMAMPEDAVRNSWGG